MTAARRYQKPILRRGTRTPFSGTGWQGVKCRPMLQLCRVTPYAPGPPRDRVGGTEWRPMNAIHTDADDGWSLVVPLKPLALAKSRLAAAAGSRLRPRLALAFAEDTVGAVLNCARVRDVVVVTDDPTASGALGSLGARIVPDTPAAGLNAALAHGVRVIRSRRPYARVATLNADLPALRRRSSPWSWTRPGNFRGLFSRMPPK